MPVRIHHHMFNHAAEGCFPLQRYYRVRTSTTIIPRGGGLFTWVELPDQTDAAELLERALKANVAFVPGASFFPCTPKKNTLRLNFSICRKTVLSRR